MNGPVLRDIHLPAEPGWWPPAPGWWMLAALAMVLLAWGLRTTLRLWRRRALMRRLDSVLGSAAQRYRDTRQGALFAAELSELLRRAARAADPPAAALSGEPWLHWLDGGDPAAPFTRGPGRVLADAPFRREVATEEAEALLPLVRTRLRTLALRSWK